MKNIIIIGLCVLLIGFSAMIGCSVRCQRVPLSPERNTKWQSYRIMESGITCDDFDNWEYLSRQSYNTTLCDTFDEERNILSCFIPMTFDTSFNRAYCGFEEGDVVWIYPLEVVK